VTAGSEPPIVNLTAWFDTPPGRYALEWEQRQIDEIVADVFGFQAAQIGLPGFDTLQNNRISGKTVVVADWDGLSGASSDAGLLVARPEALPFDSQSLDLLVLPHTLEWAEDPHAVLREAERVLMPEGRIVVTGFNPWSLWGMASWLPFGTYLPQQSARLVSLLRLRDWFKLLSFEAGKGRLGCFAPGCRSERWLQRWRFLDAAGERWWAPGGGVYAVSAVKRVGGMTLVTPAWKRKRRRRTVRRAVPVASSTRGAQ